MRKYDMICNNQITTENKNETELNTNISAFLKAMGHVGVDVFLHTGLVTISATALLTVFWLTLYFLV
jgi:hypothetical protein